MSEVRWQPNRAAIERQRESLFSFPYTHAVSVAMVSSALSLLVVTGPSPVGAKTTAMIVAAAVTSALLILLGLQWRGSVFTARGIEMFGHILGCGVWLLDTAVIFDLIGFSGYGLALVTPAVFSVAAAVRAVMLWAENREALEEVRSAARAASIIHDVDHAGESRGEGGTG